jgi:transposase InsO family protein
MALPQKFPRCRSRSGDGADPLESSPKSTQICRFQTLGQLMRRPWLTTVIDTYSRCIVGINLGFDAPSSQVVALALRHAMLRSVASWYLWRSLELKPV